MIHDGKLCFCISSLFKLWIFSTKCNLIFLFLSRSSQFTYHVMNRSENYLEVVLLGVVILLYPCIVFGYQWRRYRCKHWDWQYSAFPPSWVLLLLPCRHLNNLFYSTLSACYYLMKYRCIYFYIPVSNVQLLWIH